MLTLLFDGVAYGMLLFVLAVGLAVTLGLMNFINLAHGAFAMAGGYVTVLLMNRVGVPFLWCLPIAFVGVGALGALLHQGLGSGAVAEEVRRQLAPGARAAHVALDSSAVAVLGAALEPVWWTLCALAIVHALIVFRYPRDPGPTATTP